MSEEGPDQILQSVIAKFENREQPHSELDQMDLASLSEIEPEFRASIVSPMRTQSIDRHSFIANRENPSQHFARSACKISRHNTGRKLSTQCVDNSHDAPTSTCRKSATVTRRCPVTHS